MRTKEGLSEGSPSIFSIIGSLGESNRMVGKKGHPHLRFFDNAEVPRPI